MSAAIIDGLAIARDVRAEVRERSLSLHAATGVAPHLAAVIVGANPASETYVAMKARACERSAITGSVHRLPETASQQQVEDLIGSLNADPAVHGILVQHPLPGHLDENAALDQLSPEKDVDGISQASLGALVTGRPAYRSCTPLGIIELLDRTGVAISGAHAVVVGRSIILGKPMALLLLERHATVTICHTRTPDLGAVTRGADILVAAAGRPEMITADMVRPGAVVMDAGYSRPAGSATDVGDVAFASVSQVAGAITPVPGGVGPMTIAMLLRNTLEAAETRLRG